MTSRLFLFSRIGAAVIGTAAFWWFVLPARPEAALLDGCAAAAVACGIEATAVRIGG